MPGSVPTRPRGLGRRPSTSRRPSSSRIPISPSGCSTSSAPGTSTRVCPIPPTPCWRNASAPWNTASAPSPPPAVRRPCTWRSRRFSPPATTSSPRVPCTVAPTTSWSTRCRVSASRPLSSIPVRPTRSPRPSATTPGCCSGRFSAIRGSKCSTCPPSPRSPTTPGCPCWWTRPSRPPTCAGPSTSAPISSSIPPPSSSAATASSSAVSSSTAAPSIGRHPASFRPCRNPTPDFTTWCSPRSSDPRRSPPGRDGRASGTSAPAWRRPPRSTCSRGWRRYPSACTSTSPTPARWSPSSPTTTRWPTSATRSCRRIPTASWPGGCCRTAPARCSVSTSRAGGKPVEPSSRTCRSSPTWPTSATPSHWSSTRRAPRITGWMPRRWPPPGSAKAWCACPSASRIRAI